jgi:hypothetical protein
MFTQFPFEVADVRDNPEPPHAYHDAAWFEDYSPTLDEAYRAAKPSHPMYAMDDDEIEAKYARKDGDPIQAKLDKIIEMAFLRKRHCVNTVISELDDDSNESSEDDDDDEDPPMKKTKAAKKSPRKTPTKSKTPRSKSKAPKASDTSTTEDERKMPAKSSRGGMTSDRESPTFLEDWQGGSAQSTTESSSWAGTSDDNKAFKARKHKQGLRKTRSVKPRLATVPEVRERSRDVVTPAWEGTNHHMFSDQDFIDYACVQDPNRAIYVDPDSLEDP